MGIDTAPGIVRRTTCFGRQWNGIYTGVHFLSMFHYLITLGIREGAHGDPSIEEKAEMN